MILSETLCNFYDMEYPPLWDSYKRFGVGNVPLNSFFVFSVYWQSKYLINLILFLVLKELWIYKSNSNSKTFPFNMKGRNVNSRKNQDAPIPTFAKGEINVYQHLFLYIYQHLFLYDIR